MLEVCFIMTNKKEDIFDRLMKLPVFNFFEPFYKKNKEALLYLFFGGVSFLLNIVLFACIDKLTPLGELINNIICWFFCVLFQYITNRTWVFDAKVSGFKELFKQIVSFFGGRVLTLVIEEVILLVFIVWLDFNALAVKLIAQVIVIVLNYVISKLWVFRKK